MHSTGEPAHSPEYLEIIIKADSVLSVYVSARGPTAARQNRVHASGAILTERKDLAERRLGAIYRHVKLDTQLSRMATEVELRGFRAPVAVFALEQDVFFPGDAVVTRAREIVPNLVVAKCLRGCRHVPPRATRDHVNKKIRALFERHGRGIVNAPTSR